MIIDNFLWKQVCTSLEGAYVSKIQKTEKLLKVKYMFLTSHSHAVFRNVRDELITFQSWHLSVTYFPKSFLSSSPMFLKARPQALLWTIWKPSDTNQQFVALQSSLLSSLYAGLRLGLLWHSWCSVDVGGRDLWKLSQVSGQNVLPSALHSGAHGQVVSSWKPGGIYGWTASSFLWAVFSLPGFNHATIHRS